MPLSPLRTLLIVVTIWCAGLHHAAFDFNDEAAPIGASFFARLVERAQPLP